MLYMPAEIIKKKRNGGANDSSEIDFLIREYSADRLPDYQMAAWLMAVYFNGMTPSETSSLTTSMLHSGQELNFSHLPGRAVDKHSTGGVGDKTSLIVAPLAAAAGVYVPMIAGRGLGHTGGTLDKLEAIPGFNVNLSLDQFRRNVEKHGVSIIGQTAEICPADKRIYALRDVTATVESLPLICASIMSKKLAEGIDALVLDVKFGTGAFMKSLDQARALAQGLMEIGAHSGKRVTALLTNMDQPLGVAIGNSLEVRECLAILRNEPFMSISQEDFADTKELSLELAAAMIWLGGQAESPEDGRSIAEGLLNSGKAFEKFEEICHAQGGDLSRIPDPSAKISVAAQESGYISGFDAEKLGLAAIALGAGRLKASDTIDPTAGLIVHKKMGDPVRAGESLLTLYSTSNDRFEAAQALLQRAVSISLQKPASTSLIAERKVI